MANKVETNAEAIKKSKVLALAFGEANKWALGTGLVVGLATVAATYRSKKFDKMTSISAKVSFPIMASLGIWSYKYEVIVHDARNFPDRWGLTDDALVVEKHQPYLRMPFHHRALNYVYDHPFQWVAGLGMPLTATILYQQRHNTHLTLSQKIMHSRVFAQGSVLFILLSTMAFREYMDKHGRFPDPSEQAPSGASEN